MNEHPLQQYRNAIGLTMEALGEKLGTHKTTIMRWEDGTTPIPAEKLELITKVTGIPSAKLRPDLAAIFGKGAAA